jgi:hypothetical protein
VTDILEDQVVLFLDLLGFSEMSSRSDSDLQQQVLALLTSIASLRSDFVSTTVKNENGVTHSVRPSISTFSDHIVASYSLLKIEANDNRTKSMIVMAHLSELVGRIAIAALSMGFLIRGGVTLGKLYHAGGTVFGEALVEAVGLESRTAIYPRIVLSKTAADFFESPRGLWIASDFDGINYIDHYRDCILRAVHPGSDSEGTRRWFNNLTSILERNLKDLEDSKRMNERAKWVYFSKKLYESVSKMNPELLNDLGIEISKLPKV